MKRTGALMASMAAAASATAAAASATAAASSSTSLRSSDFSCDRTVGSSSQEVRTGGDDEGMKRSTASTDQFAPRFDGLRFIETLVTAHR
ncbi:hypothetical protein QJS04_geneDACA008322 [Acorus gramineus]|uniref:Secreted protein n=1 Tax=Acorus gramineus TaxID=55184 RepID=A0AAV9AZD3_ACOGR|nr:hypothetical protein QJS04_geneDACA008322 [Acorus gramineus]